jgi:Short C-terminal domain
MFRRRRPLMRAAVVGGTAYYAGKKVQEGRDQDAGPEEPPEQEAAPAAPAAPAGGMSEEAIEQLKQLGELKDQGILTQAEFDEQKHKLLYGG